MTSFVPFKDTQAVSKYFCATIGKFRRHSGFFVKDIVVVSIWIPWRNEILGEIFPNHEKIGNDRSILT